jgi:4-hydroxy-tetrahydrodipicolinate synthase
MTPPFPREGILAALALPCDADGRVIQPALAAHLAWLRERGIHGVLGLGSTGGFPFFSLEQRKSMLATIAELAAPLPVIANISDLQSRTVIELGRWARSLGLPGVGVMPPNFFPVAPADQLEFFLRIADAVQLPVMLYNFPELTGNRIAPETIAAFADRAPMVAIKQSGAEFAYHQTLVALGREKNFSVFSGADTRLAEVFQLGAAGCIGGLVNFVPELMLEIFHACRRGLPANADTAAARMREVGGLLGSLKFPHEVAAGVAARGFDPGMAKSIVSAETQQRFAETVSALRAKFDAWELASVGAVRGAEYRRVAA